jgi:hypothetical protein
MVCPSELELIRDLDGEASVNERRAIAEHLPGCLRCRTRIERLQAITAGLRAPASSPDPALLTAVLARTGAAPRRPGRWVVAAAGAAVAAVIGVLGWPVAPEPPGLSPRGGDGQRGKQVGVQVYLHPGSGSARAALVPGSRLGPEDGLSFEVFNRSGAAVELMIFGLDAAGEAHWFYPAFVAPGSDPRSITVGPHPERVVLEGGVAPDGPPAGRLWVVALISPQAHRITEIEAALSRGGIAELATLDPAAVVQTTSVAIGGGQ